MRTCVLLTIGIITNCCASFGQLAPTISQFLVTAIDDPKTNLKAAQIDYLTGQPYRLSPIRRVEIRTENDRLRSGEQEYRLRLSATNPWEARNTSHLFIAKSNLLNLEREVALKDALFYRYKLIIQYVFDKEEYELAVRAQNNQQSQLSILGRSQGSATFNFNKYIELKMNIIKTTSEVSERKRRLDETMFLIGDLVEEIIGSDLSWTKEYLIKTDRIYVVSDSIRQSNIPSSKIALNEKQLEIDN